MLTTPVAAIAVPVRNEAARLPRLLRALAQQRDAPPFTLCLFFDACTDDSQQIASEIASALPYAIETGVAIDCGGPPNAGRARAHAGALALGLAPARALLTTDADSEPAPDWVSANLRALALAEIVAGQPRFHDRALAPVQARVIDYYDRLHAWRRVLDPVNWEDAQTHHWTSAASLALRPNVYRALGGFGAVPCGEDADLADRAWRAGHRLRRDARVIVRTSARRDGRVEGGFATMLAQLDRSHLMPEVGHPEDEAWRYRHHALARRCFVGGDVRPLESPLRLCATELERVAADAPNADGFAARIVGAPPGGMRRISLVQAEMLLDRACAAPLTTAA